VRCRYHLGVELVQFTASDPRLLKCPMAGCIVVAVNYDATRKEPYWCRSCKSETVGSAGQMCLMCGAAYRLRHPDQRLKANRAGALH
jgi:hypothetical protein